jgi:dTDP-4-amino-4,6-dideoxygalactose transaminase
VNVPFLDLGAQDAAIGGEVRAAIGDVLASRQFILGAHVERFEAAMARYCGVAHAIGVGSGTDALLLALVALGAGPGRAVVTSPFTFFSTASTVLRLGARPVFADIDPGTLNLDPAAAAAAVEQARGVEVVGLVPVHLFGRLAPMPALRALAERRGLWIVEDAAQAIGARAGGVAAGAFGRAAALSFYPTKNLGALGDGGMVLTNDGDVAAHVRQERHQGQSAPYVHGSLGLCSRLDALQAAVLGAKLPHLDAWNARRRAVAAWYDALLVEAGLAGRPGAPLVTPQAAGEAHVFHQYVVRARARDRLRAHLSAAGIGTMVYYPQPVHLQPALAHLGLGAGAFPEAERAAREVLALPIYPELTRAHVATVVDAIARFYRADA